MKRLWKLWRRVLALFARREDLVHGYRDAYYSLPKNAGPGNADVSEPATELEDDCLMF